MRKVPGGNVGSGLPAVRQPTFLSLRRTATRIYTLALRAFPPPHRADYAAEMVDTFEREVSARIRALGSWEALRFVVAAWFDVVSAGLGERRWHRQGRLEVRRPGQPAVSVRAARKT